MDTRRWKIRKVELAGGDGHECFEIVLAELRTQKKKEMVKREGPTVRSVGAIKKICNVTGGRMGGGRGGKWDLHTAGARGAGKVYTGL